MSGPWLIPAGRAAAGAAPPAGYQISRSLRFRTGISPYLSRTPAAASDQKKWTWAGWVKRSQFGSVQAIFSAWTANTDSQYLALQFNVTDQLMLQGWASNWRISNAVYRDPSAHMFILCALDAANTTCRIEVNGVPITSWATNTTILNQNYIVNGAVPHNIGRQLSGAPSGYFDGYMSDINFIDGQYLDSSSFGQFDATTGAWVPKAYAGAYGTNGFHLDFADNSNITAATLGKDRSGNNNDWTPNQFSVTAGVSNDSLVDTPTNYGTDTGAGGEVRGDYCVLNLLDMFLGAASLVALSNGNLTDAYSGLAGHGGRMQAWGTFAVNSGKWKYEFTAGGTNDYIGLASGNHNTNAGTGTPDIQVSYGPSGAWDKNGGPVSPANGAAFTTGDVITVEYDLDAHTMQIFKNGVSQGTATSLPAAYYVPWRQPAGSTVGGGGNWNFGQRPWAFATTAGFKALCTANLPDPAILKPSQYFDINLRAGTSAAFSVTGKAFQPDLAWIKNRNGATDHALYDSARGVQKDMASNTSNAETTEPTGLTAFNADGFSGGALTKVNATTAVYVDWLWKKGVIPGVDVVAVASASAAGVPHALGVKPAMLITKTRNVAARHWVTTHRSLGNGVMQDNYLTLSTSNAAVASAGIWGGEPTATQFFAGNSVEATGESYVAYLFAEVPGFSKFGYYLGNGSGDGPFVFCGFRPRWIMVKRIDAAANWIMLDTARDPFNVQLAILNPSTAVAEFSLTALDCLSNGFKLRSGDTGLNAGTMIFAAFAEQPFKFSRAR